MESVQRTQAAAVGAPGNRLTISLLLLWTFAVAIVLAWYQPWETVGSLPQLPGWLVAVAVHEGIIKLIVAPALGCGVGSLLYWLLPGLRQKAFPCDPGHWLLLAFGFFWVAGVCSPPILIAQLQSTTSVGLLATATVLGIGSASPRMSLRWRLGLLMLSLALLWRCYLLANQLDLDQFEHTYDQWRRELFLSLNWISGVVLVFISAADAVEGRRRDILHFAGIAVPLALLFAATERYIAFLPWN